MNPVFLAVISGVLALAFAGFATFYVLRQPEGSARLKEISGAIREGALAFLHREYGILAVFVAVVSILLFALSFFTDISRWVAPVFIFGSVSSMAAGYIGMNIAIRSNHRTAAAARKSLNQGLRVSFRSGTVMGMSVVGLGIIGVAILYFAFHNNPDFLQIIPAYGFGASGVALFSRVGGGIFTKGADAGADLVGKVEKGIPEDDPRNAAAIADFVGDNVGDVAGMGADLFESYVEAIIATMVLTTVAVTFAALPGQTGLFLPLMVAAGGIVASIIGALLVRVGEQVEMRALLNALRLGTVTASVLAGGLSALAVWLLNAPWPFLWAILAGLVAGVLIGESTSYFTSYDRKPTQGISRASMTGAGPNIISGFANGLYSTVPAVLLVAIAIVVAYNFADFYGVAIAAVGMLSTLGITLATDAYGPVADNAGGIAEMGKLSSVVRQRTDALDSLGNTTAATGKGFAIGSAALSALALVLSYTQSVGIDVSDLAQAQFLSILDVRVVAGLFVGMMVPAVFCAMTMTSVGKTTSLIVEEVRRQFREIAGIMEGTAKPDYGRCVDICTRKSLREMIAPSVMAVIVPVAVGALLGKFALAAFLLGATGSGFILAVTLANAGGSWDNAKKYIEAGNFGGKGSDSHKAAVIGDTVGDPMKDTSGPSLNIMIKLMSVIALVLAPVLANWNGII